MIALDSPNAAALKLIQINTPGSQPLRHAARPPHAVGGVTDGAGNDLGQCSGWLSAQNAVMWQNVSTAPFDRDLELAVIDGDGPHVLVFPCRRILSGWMKVETKERLDVHPTHWRDWQERQEQEAGR
jgi:hypothetical protein